MMKFSIPFLIVLVTVISGEKDFGPLSSYPEQTVALNIGNVF